MSDTITLRPVTADDLDVWEREFSGPEGWGAHQWFGFQSTGDLRRRFAETGLLGPDGGVLSVVEGDVTVGRVKWFPGTWGPADLTNWSLAIGLVPSARSRGIGTTAQRLLVEYLFAHTRADRIQAWTDVANLAEQRALEKVGFVKEGVLRSAVWRDGRWNDLAIYSTLRSERGGDAA